MRIFTFILMSVLAVPILAQELPDENWRCAAKNAGDIKLTGVTEEVDLTPYRYIVNPKRGLKFGQSLNYQGSCKLLSSSVNTLSCEWDATRLIFNPDLSTFTLSNMSPSMEFVFGVVGNCLKI